MNRYPPRRSQADLRVLALAFLAVALLVSMVLPLPAPGQVGVDQPLKPPAGFAL